MQTLGNLINNEAVAGRSERHASVYNPATGVHEPMGFVFLLNALMPIIFFPGVRPSQFTHSRTVMTASRTSCARSATDNEIRVVAGSPWASV